MRTLLVMPMLFLGMISPLFNCNWQSCQWNDRHHRCYSTPRENQQQNQWTGSSTPANSTRSDPAISSQVAAPVVAATNNQPTPPPVPTNPPAPTSGSGTSPVTQPTSNNGWNVAYTTTFGDLDKWQSGYYWGNRGGNGELESYTRSAVAAIPGGGLTITATKSGNSYPSGLITTKDYQIFGPGIFASASIKIPAGQGLWPAWWLLSTQNNTGNKDELDILEEVGYQPNVMYSTLHTNSGQQQLYHNGPDLTKDFHTYSMWWENNKVIFYLDGQPVGTITKGIPQSTAYLLLNLAVGGSWPGNPDNTTPFPAVMTVKQVTVWSHGASLPSQPPTP